MTLASLPLQALVVGKLLLLKKLLLEGGDKMMVVIMMGMKMKKILFGKTLFLDKTAFWRQDDDGSDVDIAVADDHCGREPAPPQNIKKLLTTILIFSHHFDFFLPVVLDKFLTTRSDRGGPEPRGWPASCVFLNKNNI